MARLTTVSTIASLALLASSTVMFQEAAPEDERTNDPALREPTVEDIIKDLDRNKGHGPGSIAPNRPPHQSNAIPGVEDYGWAEGEKPTLLLEGTWIIGRRGRLVRSDIGGEWLYRFDADADGQEDPPMILMPSMALQTMERIAEQRGDAAVFLINGQVFLYHDRNYLLPTWYLIESSHSTGIEP